MYSQFNFLVLQKPKFMDEFTSSWDFGDQLELRGTTKRNALRAYTNFFNKQKTYLTASIIPVIVICRSWMNSAISGGGSERKITHLDGNH